MSRVPFKLEILGSWFVLQRTNQFANQLLVLMAIHS